MTPCRLLRSNILGSCSWSRSDPVMLLADNSACVAIVVVTVVHLDASHSTPTGHTRISVVPHAAYLMLLSIPAPARGDKLRLAVLHFIL